MEKQLITITALGPDDPDDGDVGRQQRGLAIAARVRIDKCPLGYKVPSQTAGNRHSYVVNVDDEPFCSCPDFETRNQPCKHVYAVEFTIQREERPDGMKVETKTMRVTYARDWTAYNQAQIHEQEMFGKLLRALCNIIVQPPQGMGRPRLPLSDVIFAIGTKVFSTFSGRRAMTDMRNAKANGQLDVTPAHTSIAHYLGKPEITPLLKALIIQSALPLGGIEHHFSPDSSGFSTSVYDRWFDEKWGKEKKRAKYIKAHIITGDVTHVVAAADVTETATHDSKYFEWLVNTTAMGFDVREVSADKAYLSRENLHIVNDIGGVAYIPFKSNSIAVPVYGEPDSVWVRAFHLYQFNRSEFLAHYHRRSNVETSFHMVKAKFGGAIRSKTTTAQVNEVLAKILCHNICVLIHSMYDLGIEPIFEDELKVAA